jgi:hypothetical protein
MRPCGFGKRSSPVDSAPSSNATENGCGSAAGCTCTILQAAVVGIRASGPRLNTSAIQIENCVITPHWIAGFGSVEVRWDAPSALSFAHLALWAAAILVRVAALIFPFGADSVAAVVRSPFSSATGGAGLNNLWLAAAAAGKKGLGRQRQASRAPAKPDGTICGQRKTALKQAT